VTRKITAGIAKIVIGLEKTLYLGNIDAKRDWGHARDYVEGMWRMLQQDEPDDYVLATGECHTVREFVEKAFKHAGISVVWKGPTGTVDEIGVEEGNEDRVLVKIDPQYFRPTEVELLLGNPAKAKAKLGWESSTPFDDLVKDMVDSDIALVKGEVPDMEIAAAQN
jgi:GDPmannose 4,6-dehydratase